MVPARYGAFMAHASAQGVKEKAAYGTVPIAKGLVYHEVLGAQPNAFSAKVPVWL
jgi:hypothetical protein